MIPYFLFSDEITNAPCNAAHAHCSDDAFLLCSLSDFVFLLELF